MIYGLPLSLPLVYTCIEKKTFSLGWQKVMLVRFEFIRRRLWGAFQKMCMWYCFTDRDKSYDFNHWKIATNITCFITVMTLFSKSCTGFCLEYDEEKEKPCKVCLTPQQKESTKLPHHSISAYSLSHWHANLPLTSIIPLLSQWWAPTSVVNIFYVPTSMIKQYCACAPIYTL